MNLEKTYIDNEGTQILTDENVENILRKLKKLKIFVQTLGKTKYHNDYSCCRENPANKCKKCNTWLCLYHTYYNENDDQSVCFTCKF